MREIDAAAPVYEQIKNLAQGGVDTANLAFGNSKTPSLTDTRYYLDAIRQNPGLQTPYEKQFYALDNAKRAEFETAIFGHPLSEQERYALLTGMAGNPLQGVFADAAAGYAKDAGISSQQLAILTVGLGVIKKSAALNAGSNSSLNNIKFGTQEKLETHFSKHGSEMKQALNKNNYSINDYLNDANHVIKTGKFVPEMNGYVKFVGGEGSAKYAFAGLDRTTGYITTLHLKTAKELAKKAPSLGINP